MLKDEERIAEVKRRIAKKEQQQRLRRRRIISAVCIAACFAVIVGVSFAMPGIVGQIEPGTSSDFETAATILGGSTAWGIYSDRTVGFCSRRVRDYSVFSHPSAEQRGADGRNKRRTMRMELFSNLFQFAVTLVGFLSEWYLVSEGSKTDLFPADLFLRLLCPWLSLLDAVSASVF